VSKAPPFRIELAQCGPNPSGRSTHLSPGAHYVCASGVRVVLGRGGESGEARGGDAPTLKGLTQLMVLSSYPDSS